MPCRAAEQVVCDESHPQIRMLTPPPLQGTPADVLYKGTISRIVGEDSPSRLDRAREDTLPKGHVIYEGKKGHVLSYEGQYRSQTTKKHRQLGVAVPVPLLSFPGCLLSRQTT